jgi:hypothetical protein
MKQDIYDSEVFLGSGIMSNRTSSPQYLQYIAGGLAGDHVRGTVQQVINKRGLV